jgi:hypothetical protein
VGMERSGMTRANRRPSRPSGADKNSHKSGLFAMCPYSDNFHNFFIFINLIN